MPPVGLQLGLAGAAGADGGGAAAGGLPHQMGPHARQPGQQILVLGQLHLQLPFSGLSPLGENVQDQAAAVQYLDPQLLPQYPHLGGGQLVVKHRQVARVGFDQFLQLLHLAVPQKAAGVRRRPVLHHHGHGLAPGGLHQGGQLLHGYLAGALALLHAGGGKPGQYGSLFLYLCVFHI